MKVALGVTGGIAAYKAAEIVRGLDRAGVQVQVVMTRNGARFITPLTLQTLSRRPVIAEPWDLDPEAAVRHIELTRDMDALAVAPCTANAMAKFARGVADDFLSTLYTAAVGPVVVAPAMNTRMWLHEATQANLRVLRGRGHRIVEPESGWLAEREEGVGRLAEPDRVVAAIVEELHTGRSLAGRTVLVTAGPTREPVDPVRFVSNRSSGKMGYALAAAARQRGARVVLVTGPTDLAPPFGVEVVPVETAAEMRDAVVSRVEELASSDTVIMAAAVADYAPRPARSKIKKSGDTMTLEMERAPDILAELGARKRRSGGPVLVGFAAETDDLIPHATAKLERKNADFIVANDVSRPGLGMDADDNQVSVLDRDGGRHDLGPAPKSVIARGILDRVFGGATP
jgi:phosphopantothenoylcysteine decarboxylase/phosphopantothenate--cysteine ligase